MEKITIENWDYPWISGKIGNLHFSAKVYDDPSEYGINGGRVSKLTVIVNSQEVARYERGWDVISEAHKSLIDELVNYLESRI